MNQLNSKEALLAHRNLVKDQINSFVKFYYSEIPELEPTTKISKLTNEIFNMLKANMKHQSPKVQNAYKDGNFPGLLELTRKLLIFLIETDNHYEKWVGYFYLHSMLKTNRIYEEWCNTRHKRNIDFEDFAKWFLE